MLQLFPPYVFDAGTHLPRWLNMRSLDPEKDGSHLVAKFDDRSSGTALAIVQFPLHLRHVFMHGHRLTTFSSRFWDRRSMNLASEPVKCTVRALAKNERIPHGLINATMRQLAA